MLDLDFLLGCFGWNPTPIARKNDRFTLFCLVIVKLVAICLTGYAGIGVWKHYKIVKHHPELLESLPYNAHVELSLLLTYVGLLTTFGWLWISTIFHILLRQRLWPWTLIFGAVHLGLAIKIATGIILQANYLPISGTCTLANAQSWKVVGEHPSFFEAVAATQTWKDEKTKLASPSIVCDNWLINWQWALYALIVTSIVCYTEIYSDPRPHSILNPGRPLCFCLRMITYPFVFAHNSVFPRIRFSYHCILKCIQRLRGLGSLDIPSPTVYVRQHPYHVQNPKLQHILTIEHLLRGVVQNLHYEDVINLSLTSRSVRDAVFPSRDLEYRVPKLKKWACGEATKTACFYCNKLICETCQSKRLNTYPPARRHVLFCKPYCRKCYYASFSQHPRHHLRRCDCTWSTQYLASLHNVCPTCRDADMDILHRTRNTRFAQQVRDIALAHVLPHRAADAADAEAGSNSDGDGDSSSHNAGNAAAYPTGPEVVDGTKCGSCDEELRPGMRFWVCGECGGECRGRVHPAFGGRRGWRRGLRGGV